MARADLLVNLVQAGSHGDQQLFQRTVEALAAEERAKNHHVLADQLVQHLQTVPGPSRSLIDRAEAEVLAGLLREVVPRRRLSDLVLPDVVQRACDELIEEQHRVELLRAHNLEPRSRLLLAGPPGNGKTSLAETLAEALMVPLYVMRYEGVVGSYLGETAQRLRKIFDFARRRRCVLFLDEFDTLGKERGDVHETGEIKRVVSSLLLQLDELPSHTVVVVATNHPELLDRAVWRRFQLRLELPLPNARQITQWFERFEARMGSLGWKPATLGKELLGACFSELEAFGLDIRRRAVLAGPQADLGKITTARIEQFRARFSTPVEAQI